MEKLTMTKEMGIMRTAFGEVVQSMEVAGFEFRGRYEKGFLFSDENDHFVTVAVTAHKWESETTEGFDGLGMLEQYEEKQLEKQAKEAERVALKAKKIAEKEKAKALKEAEKATPVEPEML